MFNKVVRVLTPIFLITLVAVALTFIPFEANSDFDESPFIEEVDQNLPEGTFP